MEEWVAVLDEDFKTVRQEIYRDDRRAVAALDRIAERVEGLLLRAQEAEAQEEYFRSELERQSDDWTTWQAQRAAHVEALLAKIGRLVEAEAVVHASWAIFRNWVFRVRFGNDDAPTPEYDSFLGSLNGLHSVTSNVVASLDTTHSFVAESERGVNTPPPSGA